MQEKVSIMCSWCGWENPSLGLRAASLVTAYAALRPRDGFSHPHQEHMKDTYNINLEQPVLLRLGHILPSHCKSNCVLLEV